MNILVLLRAIQDPLGLTVNRRAQKVFVNREQYLFNPSDRNALEAALRLGGDVTVVAFGEAPAEQVLRDARAMGAAHAIQIKDATLPVADAYILTLVLKRVVEQAAADLVLLGHEVVDADLAQIGPRLAQALGWPLILAVHRVEARDGVVRAIAPRGPVFHNAEADLPAVLTVARDSNKPRYGHLGQTVTIYTQPAALQVWTAADLGLSEADLAPVLELRGESFPPERELGRKLDGDEAARELAAFIRKI
jgi:electron transfer flavoprotein beta subunit